MSTHEQREQARKSGVNLAFEDAMLRELGGEDFRELGDTYEVVEQNVIVPVRQPPSPESPSAARTHLATSSVLPSVNLEFEDRMMQHLGTEVADSKGYFMPRSWLFDQSAEVLLNLDDNHGSGGTFVHTFLRNGNNRAVVHDKHPFVAAIHLIRNATPNTQVYVSMPFFTDLHFIDELCHYAKPEVEGGKNLTIRIILGPEEWVRERLKLYVTSPKTEAGRNLRKTAVDRLHVRIFGSEGAYVHSKTLVSSAGALMGSYNYTYAARLSHFEEGIVLPPGPQVEELKERMTSLWNYGQPFIVHSETPPGYCDGNVAKKTKTAK